LAPKKIELEEENLGGHDPNTDQSAVGHRERQRHKILSNFNKSFLKFLNTVFDGDRLGGLEIVKMIHN